MSVAKHGQHMVVSADGGHMFTYMLDQHSNTWINNGKLSAPGGLGVSIQNEVLVITVNDMDHRPDVCGIVYKLTSATTTTRNNNKHADNIINNNNNNSNNNIINNNSNNNIINNNKNSNNIWVEIARLTTKGDPMRSHDQKHDVVSSEASTIFTGRFDYRHEGVCKVFKHELPNYNNEQN